jgi:NADH dehydrogenase/NADH:ubiquinone oxidoreductase subunit G
MSQVKLTINGRAVQAERGTIILDFARSLGIEIPTLCHHAKLMPYGACRLCLVEIGRGKRSRLVASCGYYVEDGLEVQTESERVKKVRGLTLELLLAMMHNSQEIKTLARKYGVASSRYKRNYYHCILCGLCVRYCEEVKGASCIGYVGRGVDREIAWVPPESFEAVCKDCDECKELCPTGVFPSNWGLAQGSVLK